MRWSWGILGLIGGSVMGNDLGDGQKGEIVALRIALALGLGCLGFWLGLRRERTLAAAGVIVQGPALSQVVGGLLGGAGGGALGAFIAAQVVQRPGGGLSGNVVNDISRGCAGCVDSIVAVGLGAMIGVVAGLLLGVWLATIWARRRAASSSDPDPDSDAGPNSEADV